MSDVIYEYTNSSLTIVITRIDDDYQFEAFGEAGRMMCLRFSYDDAVKMAQSIIVDASRSVRNK
jgi:hypothetical protein